MNIDMVSVTLEANETFAEALDRTYGPTSISNARLQEVYSEVRHLGGLAESVGGAMTVGGTASLATSQLKYCAQC